MSSDPERVVVIVFSGPELGLYSIVVDVTRSEVEGRLWIFFKGVCVCVYTRHSYFKTSFDNRCRLDFDNVMCKRKTIFHHCVCVG